MAHLPQFTKYRKQITRTLDLPNPVWERIAPEESQTAYRAFLHYRDSHSPPDSPRSFLNTYRTLYNKDATVKNTPGFLLVWSQKFLWKDRARAWDDQVTNKSIKEAQASIDMAVSKWLQIHAQDRDANYKMGQVVRKIAAEVLLSPVTSPSEKLIGARMAEIAAQLTERAIGPLPTEVDKNGLNTADPAVEREDLSRVLARIHANIRAGGHLKLPAPGNDKAPEDLVGVSRPSLPNQ